MGKNRLTGMGRYRALMTDTDRKHITGESSPSQDQKDQAIYRVRQRIREEMPRDLDVLEEHRPDVLEELRDVVFDSCPGTTGTLRLDELEGEVSGSTAINVKVFESAAERKTDIEVASSRLGKKYRMEPNTVGKLRNIVKEGAVGTLYVGEKDPNLREYRVKVEELKTGSNDGGNPCIRKLDLLVLESPPEI